MNEPCLFTWRKDGNVTLVVLYVDDMICASNLPEKLEEITSHFEKIFKMKVMGEPKYFLGMKITRNKEKQELTFTMPNYTEKVLERFGMRNCKAQKTPMITRQVRSKNLKNVEDSDSKTPTNAPFRATIGSLLYRANVCRPESSYLVTLLLGEAISSPHLQPQLAMLNT